MNIYGSSMIISEIGSFVIIKNKCTLGVLYTVQYKEEHNAIYKWSFLNDLATAELFATKKTKIDKKLFKTDSND